MSLSAFFETILPGLPSWLYAVLAALTGAVIVFTIALTVGGLFTFVFRRIFAAMGQRSGPNRVGPQGIFQFLADGLKLISKEDIRPARADRVVWATAVYVAVAFTVVAWGPLPWSDDVFFSNVGTGILFILAFSAIAPLGELMAGWGSNNKYSLYGGIRAAALDISYEIPMLITVGSVLLLVGSLRTQDIVLAQGTMWFIVPQVLGFGIFFVTAIAKAGLVPTDLAESESELVAGFTTEYSGMRFGMFFVVIFSNVFFISALTTTLFLGGWRPLFGLTFIPPLAWFLLKTFGMSFVVFWVWTTLPRVRVDQYLNVAWKVILPLSILNFVVTAVALRAGWLDLILPHFGGIP